MQTLGGWPAQIGMEIIVEPIRSLSGGISRIERLIHRAAQKLPGLANLTSIKGTGSLGAGVLLLVIGNIKDFPEGGKLASYFGIVPRVQIFKENQYPGHIAKRGSKLGRTTLVQCVFITEPYSLYLNQYYEGILTRCGTGKAIIVLSRSLLDAFYQALKDNWVFEDSSNFGLANAKD